VQLATTAHGFRSIIHTVNMYVKHLPTTRTVSLQQTAFSAASYHLSHSQWRNSTAIISLRHMQPMDHLLNTTVVNKLEVIHS
jgi:hypothetical protein